MFCICGDRAQRKPHFAREKPFCGNKTLCLKEFLREKVRKKHLYFASLFFKDLLTFLLEMATI